MKLLVGRRNLKDIMQKVALLACKRSVIQKFSFKYRALSVLHQWAITERLVSSRHGFVSEKTWYLIFHTVIQVSIMHQPATPKCTFGFPVHFAF